VVKKKRNPSDVGENPMGSSNGDMLSYLLSNSLSLLNVQLECSAPYLLPRLYLIPISDEINSPQEKIFVFFQQVVNAALLTRQSGNLEVR
jgi:hypothetical protein